MPNLEEAALWLGQSEMDLDTARKMADAAPYAACFYAQQAAEKALKAVCLAASGVVPPRIRSVGRLISGLMDTYGQFKPFLDSAAQLDSYYIGTRYPHAELGQVPGRSYTSRNAHDAVQAAEPMVRECQLVYGGLVEAARASREKRLRGPRPER